MKWTKVPLNGTFCQKQIDYSGLQACANQGSTATWTIGFDDNIQRTAASKQLRNALVPHLSNRPLRVNINQLALQNPADLKRLVTLLDLPRLLEEITGTETIDPVVALMRGKLRIKEGAGRYVLELICLPNGVDQGTIERYLGQKEIDYSGLQARDNQSSTVTWTIGFDDNIQRTAASKQLGNALVPHLSNRPLRVNIKHSPCPEGCAIFATMSPTPWT